MSAGFKKFRMDKDEVLLNSDYFFFTKLSLALYFPGLMSWGIELEFGIMMVKILPPAGSWRNCLRRSSPSLLVIRFRGVLIFSISASMILLLPGLFMGGPAGGTGPTIISTISFSPWDNCIFLVTG